MHPYEIIKEAVLKATAEVDSTVVQEDLRPDAFGSAVSVIQTRGHRLRVVWDGKEGAGWVERASTAPGGWSPVGPWVTEREVDWKVFDESKLSELLGAVRLCVLGGRSG